MANVPVLQSAADQSASLIAGAASSLVPSGVVMAYAGATPPTGWLLCNGAAISRVTYASLFAAINTAHGYGDNIPVTGTFNIPDYRGRFIRGTDTMGTAASRDPDRATRTAALAGGNTGDAVGSVQVNATAKNGLTASSSTPTFTGTASTNTGNVSIGHTHSLPGIPVNGGSTPYGFSSFLTGNSANATVTMPSTTTGDASANHQHSFTSSGTVTAPTITVGVGDSETRPLNAYVNYIIKI